MSGMSTRLETKPGASLTATGFLPRRSATCMVVAKVASLVCSARMTSTSTITGTGFMKCMPTKRSGRLVSAASQHSSLLCRLELAFLDFAVEIFRDGVDGAVEKALLDIAQQDLVAGAREYMRDAVPHSARA